MTDTEWTACDDTRRMFEALRGKATPRKLRLLACAAARCLSRVAVDPVGLKTLVVAERYADGGVTEQERDDAFTVAGHHSNEVESLGFERWAFACLANFSVGSLVVRVVRACVGHYVARSPPSFAGASPPPTSM